tara:strand:- start:315 stop:491 length:177 start_codon:yes stop_codon:yes gene_type:complete
MTKKKESTESVDDALKRGVVVVTLKTRGRRPKSKPRIAKKPKRNRFISVDLNEGNMAA